MSTINCDPTLVRIILQNLLSNAVSYTAPKGVIKVAIKAIDSSVAIEVKDNGCGIPKDAQPKIFTKFFRADNARTVKPDGTGLGLYITKSVVEALGGTISFKSIENKGTMFIVTLPKQTVATRKSGKKLV